MSPPCLDWIITAEMNRQYPAVMINTGSTPFPTTADRREGIGKPQVSLRNRARL